MLRFDEFISSHNKKIIIGENLGDLDALIKYFVKENKTSYSNFERETILELAKAIFYANNLEKKYIDNESLNALFFSFLNSKRDNEKKDIYDLIPDDSFNLETSKICLKSINEIRKGKIIKENKKLTILINDFEKHLLSLNLIDDILLIKSAISNINKSDKATLEKILLINDDYCFAILKLCNDKLSFLAYSFITALMNKLNKTLNIIDVFNENKNLKINSYGVFGYYQEVLNLISIIDKDKLPIQDVLLITSDNKYDNSLKAYLENYHIPYHFKNGVSITSTNQYGLLSSVVDFISNHYSITALFDIYRNTLIKEEYKNIKNLNLLRADINQIKVAASNSDNFNALQQEFIFDLLKINKDDDISLIYQNIINFIYKYIDITKEANLKEALESKISIFKILDDVNSIDKLKAIKQIVSNIKIDIVLNEESYLTITNIAKVNYLDKKYVFFLGLSSSQMSVKEIESPLISDKELSSLIDTNYYVNLASLNNKRFNEKLEQLIKYNNVTNLYLSYSYYDSNEFRILSKSPFYLKYRNNETSPRFDIDIAINDLKDSKSPNIIENDAFNLIKKKNHFSPSSLNKLYKCPLDYIYSKYYLDITCNEYDNNWLDPNESGTFIHKILEQYYLTHLSKKVDKDDFDKIVNKVKDEAILEHPFDNVELINRYVERYKKILFKYINDNNKDAYKVLGCEIKFKDILIKLNNKNYYFGGSIDRVDYYLNEANKKVSIRIYDYKTGSKKNISNDGLTQSFIYVYAIKQLIKQGMFAVIDKTYDIECEFYYVYFKENKRDVLIDEEDRLINIKSNEEQLRNFDMLDNSIESYLDIYHPDLVTVGKNNISKCDYCTYQKYCALKKKIGINKSRK